jgi:hypothetical protein
LQAGSKVPADCLLLEGSELMVSMADDDAAFGHEAQAYPKTPYHSE